MANLERDIERLRKEIAKRRDEVVTLDRKAAELAAPDPEASLTADTRARGIERLIARIRPELAALVSKKAADEMARAREVIEAGHGALREAITEEVAVVNPLVSAFVEAFRALMANRYGAKLVLQLLPDFQSERYVSIALANLEEMAPHAQAEYAATALAAADSRAGKVRAARERIDAESAALLSEDGLGVETAPTQLPIVVAGEN